MKKILFKPQINFEMETFKNTIDTVVFHYPCQDGIASAWVAYHYYNINHPSKVLRLFPAQHGKELNYDMVSQNIIFLDFCPSRDVISQLHNNLNNIFILDHHITARNDLNNCDFAKFDMEKSGVGLAWDYFFPNIPIPTFLAMIQERDLWKFRIEKTQEFTSGLFFETDCLQDFYKKFELFDELKTNPEKLSQIINLGTLLNTHKQLKISHIVKKIKENKYYCTDKNGKSITIICYNCSSDITSDLGNALSSIHCDLAILWNYDHLTEEYLYSLRSTNKIDCASIANKYLSGGGHPNAAGGKHIYHPTELIKSVLFR